MRKGTESKENYQDQKNKVSINNLGPDSADLVGPGRAANRNWKLLCLSSNSDSHVYFAKE